METDAANFAQLLNLQDAQLTQFTPELRHAIMRQASYISYQGLLIAAPKRIDVQGAQQFPLLLLRQNNALREARLNVDKNTIIVCVNLDTGHIILTPAEKGATKRQAANLHSENVRETASEEVLMATMVTDAVVFDLCVCAGVAWQPGRYAMTVISYNWISNTIAAQLMDSEQTQAVRQTRLSAEKAAQLLQSIRAKPMVPELSFATLSPDLPGQGVQLALPTAWKAGDDPVQFRASIRMPLQNALLVEVNAESLDHHTPVAFVEMVVYMAQYLGDSKRVTLQIPLHVHAGVHEQTIAFSIRFDLFQAIQQDIAAGAYYVYLFVGPFATKPCELVIADDIEG